MHEEVFANLRQFDKQLKQWPRSALVTEVDDAPLTVDETALSVQPRWRGRPRKVDQPQKVPVDPAPSHSMITRSLALTLTPFND